LPLPGFVVSACMWHVAKVDDPKTHLCFSGKLDSKAFVYLSLYQGLAGSSEQLCWHWLALLCSRRQSVTTAPRVWAARGNRHRSPRRSRKRQKLKSPHVSVKQTGLYCVHPMPRLTKRSLGTSILAACFVSLLPIRVLSA
jgi:hypothetical protein